MVTKFISLTAAITTVDLAANGRINPGAPVYYFASSQLWINIILIAVVGLSVAVSFMPKGRFNSWYSYSLCSVLAMFLIILGGLGVFYSNFKLDGWDLLLPLDYLMLLECGVVLAVSSLSYRHPRRPAEVNQFAARLAGLARASSLAVADGLKAAHQAARDSALAASQFQRRLRVKFE